MKFIVDRMPDISEKCPFFRCSNKNISHTYCELEKDCTISSCYGIEDCPHLISLVHYINKTCKEGTNGLL